MDNQQTDNLFKTYRDDLIVIIRMIMDIGDFFSSEEYRTKDFNNGLFFRRVYDHTQRFLKMVQGVSIDQISGLRFDRKSWNLPAVIFRMNSIEEMPEEKRAVVENVAARCFYYGLLYHLYAWQSPDLGAMDRIDLERVIQEWSPLSFNSYVELKTYDDLSNYIPSRVFTYYHERAIKPSYKGWRFGYFKRIKAEAFFQRLFFAGVLLSVKAVEQTAKQ